MISFPNCKINLGLSVTAKREDGYHTIETVFHPIQLKDALEFTVSSEMKFESSGLSIPGEPGENLIMKAYDLLKKDFSFLPNLHIHLHKKIPIGGGLGGGSSDAAFMLKMLNEYFDLGIKQVNEQGNSGTSLFEYALRLGSDCPFFIFNHPCLAIGRGEMIEPISLDLSGYIFLIVCPHIHITTSWAFQQLKPVKPQKLVKEVVQRPIAYWKDELKNDFEESIFKAYPSLMKIKIDIYDMGAIYSSMSGSGSTMYGIFERSKLEELQEIIRNRKLFKTFETYFI